MKYIKVIIGSNFGDEGKGLMTDYMCSINENPIVIRFNSSAQAGHTVVTPDGKRHVFGHFCSGNLQGIPTFLSNYFSVNPLLFLKEYDELKMKNIDPYTMIDLTCPVIIPQDMILNQIVERYRGDNRHGSCGLGYNESIIRNNIERYKITCNELLNKNYIDKLELIKNEYIKDRLQELNLVGCKDKLMAKLYDDSIISHFIDDIGRQFIPKVHFINIKKVAEKYNTLIFEGAQGLMLSEDYKYFPHVTHSKTGISNVINLLEEINNYQLDIEVIYLTRSYLTRHGAGHLPNEVQEKPYKNIIDSTNISNEFQGTLRFAPLDIDLLAENIQNDYTKILPVKQHGCWNIKKSIGLTCLDQIDNDEAIYYKNNLLCVNSTNRFVEEICEKIKPENCYLSYGKTRNTIIKR
ncbi:adenylosuccinate synthetase [Clostridium chromiireducens]|uniref:Adenylosuccinate synthetase n=1 Tax=Clostridium chromiireducens TaxID=225345 RepID=A0A1V4IEK3_9CLOT|nr:adenylosuccinate synthetase [Clostridium chromiireducens]OPJ57967.1 adenylosuccinate synthetase [Clostridium chromiireducens]